MLGNEPVWTDLECVGEQTGEKYFGRFQVKRYLTHRERGEAVRLAETLCRGIETTIEHRTLLTTIAFLSSHIIESDAKWWGDRGLDLLDEQPIWELAKKIRELQRPAEQKDDGEKK